MFCSHCGRELAAEDNFCAACGTPVRERPGAGQSRHETMVIDPVTPDTAVQDQPTAAPEPEPPHDEVTTISIDMADEHERELLEDLPSLPPGTGLFVIVRGPLAGARYMLEDEVTMIGRHPDADLLLDDVTVSRHHAEVRRNDDQLLLVDLGSLNGTYVGSHRIEEHVLEMGDHIQIGRFKLVYVAANAEAIA